MSEKKLMDKDDAKYLIDQFNKYVSWSVGQPTQLLVAGVACFIAMIALVITAMSVYRQEIGLVKDVPLYGWPYLGLMVLASIMAVLTGYGGSYTFGKYRDSKDKLHVLMNFFSRHQSLPCDLTFEKIVRQRPKDLESFLG